MQSLLAFLNILLGASEVVGDSTQIPLDAVKLKLERMTIGQMIVADFSSLVFQGPQCTLQRLEILVSHIEALVSPVQIRLQPRVSLGGEHRNNVETISLRDPSPASFYHADRPESVALVPTHHRRSTASFPAVDAWTQPGLAHPRRSDERPSKPRLTSRNASWYSRMLRRHCVSPR